jgi:hypothetical protein
LLEKFGLVCEGEAQERIPSLQTQPAADVGAVILNGSNADRKLASDVAGTHFCCDELQHPSFSGSELIQARPLLH